MYLVDDDSFRHLLLVIRPELEAHDIPHRTRLTELILQKWREQFAELKEALSVRFSPPLISQY